MYKENDNTGQQNNIFCLLLRTLELFLAKFGALISNMKSKFG